MDAIYDYGQRRKEEGFKEGFKKFAKYMIKDGKTNEEIQKETGLTIKEIKKLEKTSKIQEKQCPHH